MRHLIAFKSLTSFVQYTRSIKRAHHQLLELSYRIDIYQFIWRISHLFPSLPKRFLNPSYQVQILEITKKRYEKM